MALWIITKIEYLETIPDETKQKAFAEYFQEEDYDFPAELLAGVEKSWRHPLIDLSDVLAYLHSQGYPCKGYQYLERGCNQYREVREADWQYSTTVSSPE